MMTFEIESDAAPDPKLIGSLPGGKLQSRLQFSAGDWREEPKTVTADTPVVLVFSNYKLKDANEKNPVTVHCSFVYMALKDGKAAMKTMGFDLYLDKLEPTKGEIVYYPWKVKSTQYK